MLPTNVVLLLLLMWVTLSLTLAVGLHRMPYCRVTGNHLAPTSITINAGTGRSFQSTAWLRVYFPAMIPTGYEMDAWLQKFPYALLMQLAALFFFFLGERWRNVVRLNPMGGKGMLRSSRSRVRVGRNIIW